MLGPTIRQLEEPSVEVLFQQGSYPHLDQGGSVRLTPRSLAVWEDDPFFLILIEVQLEILPCRANVADNFTLDELKAFQQSLTELVAGVGTRVATRGQDGNLRLEIHRSGEQYLLYGWLHYGIDGWNERPFPPAVFDAPFSGDFAFALRLNQAEISKALSDLTGMVRYLADVL